MYTPRSDAYYLVQLIERLTQLEAALSKKINPQAELTQRSTHLLKELQNLLTMGDEQAMDILEYALLPKIHRFLGEVRTSTVGAKLQAPKLLDLKNIGLPQSKPQTRIALRPVQPQAEKRNPPLTPEQREALIEDALTRLKMLLSEP